MIKEKFVDLRNCLIRFFYQAIFKPIFFQIDPEKIHDWLIKVGQILGSHPITKKLTACFFSYSNKRLEQKIFGITFSNPVGLAAGFDKDGVLTDILPSIGFGFVEIGSITGEPCKGNPKPRLWRLIRSKGLVVHYGLKNQGCEKISQRLKNKNFQIPIGTSIAKTNSQKTVRLDEGIADYLKAYKKFTNIGNYFAINLSCPNVFGGQDFQEPKRLDKLLAEIDQIPTEKPVFLKISPDLERKEIDQIVEVAKKHQVAGFICANVTQKRITKKIADDQVPKKGGISGKPTEELTNDLIGYLYRQTKGKFLIIGCGGVFCAEDAYQKIKLGASLIQLFTGMIFEGPQVVNEINHGLVNLLQKDGLPNISQAIGMANR